MWALPSSLSVLAVLSIVKEVEYDFDPDVVKNINLVWSSFQFLLGFLVVFRTQQAYMRYMEGAALLRDTRAEWFNAVSSLIAFSSTTKEKRKKVEHFQHLLIRLMSLLSCCTLQSMADFADDVMPVISLQGIDDKSLAFVIGKEQTSHRAEIVTQWVQKLVVQESAAGVLDVPPPILSRFYQELSRGSVCANRARNLTDIPFPFPYSQMLTVLLIVHAIATPLIAAILLQSTTWAVAITFISVLGFWGTNYIAVEIESPFGDDPNDLPLVSIQQDFNASLWILLERQSQDVPVFSFQEEIHRKWRVELFAEFEAKTKMPVPWIKARSREGGHHGSMFSASFVEKDSGQDLMEQQATGETSSATSAVGAAMSHIQTELQIARRSNKKHLSRSSFAKGNAQLQALGDLKVSDDEEQPPTQNCMPATDMGSAVRFAEAPGGREISPVEAEEDPGRRGPSATALADRPRGGNHGRHIAQEEAEEEFAQGAADVAEEEVGQSTVLQRRMWM